MVVVLVLIARVDVAFEVDVCVLVVVVLVVLYVVLLFFKFVGRCANDDDVSLIVDGDAVVFVWKSVIVPNLAVLSGDLVVAVIF